MVAPIGETAAGAGQGLVASLDFPLPRTLTPGRGSALFACGWCVSPGSPVRELELVLDGEAVPVRAQGMPRGDVLETLSPDPPAGSLMSGFWGVVPIGPHEPGQELELVLRARLEDGSEAVTPLGGIQIVEPVAPLELRAP